jgi:lipopolysaccharide transport system ATP-binding protein
VSHNMSAIKNLCTRVVLIENGKIISNGNTDDMISLYLSQMKKNKDDFDDLDRKGNGIVKIASVEIGSKDDDDYHGTVGPAFYVKV